MAIVNAQSMTDDALLGYDKMMIECTIKVRDVSALAVHVWGDVLKELDRRGKVKLVSGSYEDVGNAIIHRIE